jgi:hypothetical protein
MQQRTAVSSLNGVESVIKGRKKLSYDFTLKLGFLELCELLCPCQWNNKTIHVSSIRLKHPY